jgi:aconitate hydratase
LTGQETFEIEIDDRLRPKQNVVVKAGGKTFTTSCRIDTPVEIEYFRNGGILQTVLRRLLKS